MIPADLDSLQIVLYPDPVLKRVAHPVDVFSPAVEALGHRMLELMRRHEGVGLAAPQVGLGLRMFVCNATGEDKDDMICVNPSLHDLGGQEEQTEGCLSIPNVSVAMRRAVSATLAYSDAAGKRMECKGEGLLARIWQHEFDHLEGRLIIDGMPTTDEIANRRAIKQLKEDYAATSKRARG